MEPILSRMLQQFAAELLSNPQTLESLFGQLFDGGCHTSADVAQDALDAWESGHLSTEACRKIIEAVLEDRGARARNVSQPLDLSALLRDRKRAPFN